MKPSFFDAQFEKLGPSLALAGAFLLPLKLALAYSALVPLIILWLLRGRWLPRYGASQPFGPAPRAFLCFIAVAFVSSFFGIEPTRSLPKFINLAFFALSMFVFAELGRTRKVTPILGALISGQLLAATHTILEGATFGHLPKIFLGEVTESGQLGLQIPLALGLATWLASETLTNTSKLQGRPALLRFPRVLCVGALNLASATILGLAPTLQLPPVFLYLLGATLLSGIGAIVHRARNRPDRYAVALIGIVLPLLVAALLVNLKRGPWAGTFVGLVVFLCVYARALLAPLLLAMIAVLTSFEPVRERLLLSMQHFSIAGGRSMLWEIGAELASRFPMGIGYHNSRFLRLFSTYIPPSHTHFHNNFLNILVETGWLGLGCFLWWIVAVVRSAFSSRRWSQFDILSCAIGCSVISWQVAGLVEYNFGDSEVVNIIYILLGVLLALRHNPTQRVAESTHTAPQSTAVPASPTA
ncbi:MAG: O-antigen ligase domain-containing protein [Proteobacteria bacterium]|nr:O-antigen ligase domain-containing protein [Pseudomonadota bacterium]